MKFRKNYLLISIISLTASVTGHSAHSNHTENATEAGSSGFSTLLAGYPDTTVYIALAEITLGLTVWFAAFWHFYNTS
jgi:hypothetical protein